MVARGFYIGRFQPYHEGHRRVVRTIADEVDELVVGIGSAYASHTIHDPFTAGERILMCNRALADVELMTYTVPVEDVERNSVWVSHVRSLSPRFDVAYSNNPLVRQLFEEAGIEVHTMPMFDRDVLRGTEIRRRMVEGDPWRDLVPDPVVEVVEEVGGVKRLRRVTETDADGDGTGGGSGPDTGSGVGEGAGTGEGDAGTDDTRRDGGDDGGARPERGERR